MKRQGQRSDLTSATKLQKSAGKTSREILAEQVGESQEQIRKYIRLTLIIPELLQMVDDGKIACRNPLIYPLSGCTSTNEPETGCDIPANIAFVIPQRHLSGGIPETLNLTDRI